MKKALKYLLLAAACVLFGTTALADEEPLEVRSADAGASKYFSSFLTEQENANEILQAVFLEIAPQTVDHVKDYEEAKTGVVSAEAILNIRETPDTSSQVLGVVVREAEVTVTGEVVENGNLWYRVQVGDMEGYAAGDYILFGDDADAFLQSIKDKLENVPTLPESFAIQDRTERLEDSVQTEINDLIEQINYCLKDDFNAQQEAGSTVGMYSVLIYLVENYVHVKDLAFEYGLERTYRQASKDLEVVEANREYISYVTGQTEDDLVDQILQAKAEEEAAKNYSLGSEMAQYAATFVGWLPYIWGGASLKDGADCSGFVAQIAAHFGLLDQAKANYHGYDSGALRSVGYEVSIADIQPGDIVCYNGHVAMYYGEGLVVHEPSPGKKAAFGYLHMMNVICVRRVIY